MKSKYGDFKTCFFYTLEEAKFTANVENEQELEKTTSKFRKEKLLIKDIEIIGINDDFLEKADKLELINLIKNYLTIDEKIVKNEIKDQWDSNKDINNIGVNEIKFKINKGEK